VVRSTVARYRDGVWEAAATIRAHPLRASLSALAVAAAVGTSAVVQTSLGSLERAAREVSARAFGSDTFVVARVASGSLSRRELAERLQRNLPITRTDLRFVERVAGGRVIYAATAQRAGDVTAGARKFENATINGTQASLFDIRDIGIERGRFITADEDLSGALVVVAGRAVTDTLFPGRDPLGETVRIAGRGFRIVGLQLPQGTSGGVSLDRYMWMPLRAFERAFGTPPSLQIFAAASQTGETASAEDRARVSMRARRQIAPNDPDSFDIVRPEASRNFVAAITERIGAAGPPISFMALLAAIVVVANTTLVSVAQQTREIGVRRAVGAMRRDVAIETLAEATMVSIGGGAAGLLVAMAVLSLASRTVGIPLQLTPLVAGASLLAAGASGVVAGWYPARRAATIDVIRALRREA
jgi:putative ABC transport system permease protein